MAESRRVFVSEFDDDYQELLVVNDSALLKRVYCYVLLSDGLIVHPAYLWQSTCSNELVLQRLVAIFRPPLFEVALGDSEDIVAYIRERIERLERYRVRETTKELRQYKRWETTLLQQALRLQGAFGDAGYYRGAQSRDSKFRALLDADLVVGTNPFSISALIAENAQSQRVGGDVDETRAALRHFVANSPLVSLETFANRVRARGMPDLTEDTAFKKRLLDLYYYANADSDILVPGASGLSSVETVNPFDANVFWRVFRELFGQKPHNYLSASSDPVTVRFIRDLRDTDVWQAFRGVYFSVLRTVGDDLRQNEEALSKAIRIESGYDSVRVLGRVWRRHKLEIAAAAFGALSISSGPAVPIVAGAVSLLLGLRRLPAAIKRYVDDYYAHDLTQLRHKIRQAVSNAVREEP
jgi:hypothetical protein